MSETTTTTTTGTTGATGSTGTTTTTAPTTQDWTSNLSDDFKGYVQNKGFKDPSSVLESYRNLEKLHGVPADRLLKLPEKSDDPAWNQIFEKLGRPSDAKEYSLLDAESKEKLDEGFEQWARSTFHEANLTNAQAAKLTAKMMEYTKGKTEAKLQEETAAFEAQNTALKKEWGAAYEQEVNVAKQAAARLGVKGEQIDALEKVMGFADTMKFFRTLGAKLGEDKFHGSGEGSGAGFGMMTPAAAQNRIQALKGDEGFAKRLAAGDAQALGEWNKLHQQAYPS